MEDKASKWTQKLRRCERILRDKREESIRYKKAYLGDFTNRAGDSLGKYAMRMSLVYYYVETIMPALFHGEPKIRVKPKRDPALTKNAKLLEYNTNYWAKELDVKAELKDALFDSFFGPTAIYTGWDFKTRARPDGTEIVDTDQPVVRWLNFFEEVRIDPDVLRSRRARWMAMRVTVPHSEFVEMEGIKKEYRVGKKAIRPTMRPEDVGGKQDDPYRDDKKDNPSDAEWVTYWEVWDRERMERKLVHELIENDYLNQDISWPFNIEVKNDAFPITILHAKIDPFGPFSNSEFKPLEDHIYERIRLRSVQAAQVRRLAPKFIFGKGLGTKDQINKFQKSDIMSMNEFNDPTKLALTPMPEIPNGWLEFDNILGEDFGNMSGLTEFENSKIANTATEASIAEGRSNVRKSARSNQFEEFVATVLAKVAMLIQQLQNRETTFIISGREAEDGLEKVINVTKEEIQGEYCFDVIPGSMEFENEELAMRNFTRFYELALNDPEANRRYLIEEMSERLGVDPKRALLTPEEKAEIAKSQAEPSIKIGPIKMEDITNPMDRVRIVEAAKKQNNVTNLNPANAAMAQGQIANLERTIMPTNQSMNKAGYAEPEAPVHPASMGPER